MTEIPLNSDTDHPHSACNLPAPLMIWTSFLLRQASLRVQTQVAEALVSLGLRPTHNAALTVLADGPLSQVALAAQLQIDRTSMVGLLDELEHMGLVRRQRNPRDRRAHEVTLTAQGRVLLAHAHAQVTIADAIFFASLSAAELEQLRSLLVRLIQAHDAAQDTP